MSSDSSDVLVVGAGIVGLATARALLRDAPSGRSVRVLEAEPAPARHQTGRNSGVIHSGLYYRPGSLKAGTCVAGRRALLDFCRERSIPYRLSGKVVVATHGSQLPQLEELASRGAQNGLADLRRLGPEEIRELEPAAHGVAGLHVPETGVVDFGRVATALAEEIRERGGELRLSHRVTKVERTGDELEVTAGNTGFRTGFLVNCAGLYSDRLARLCGLDPRVRIVPFRGEYHDLRPERAHLCRTLIYPVPDPRFPFLGVHLTRSVDDHVHAGPSAVLAGAREGYTLGTVSARDLFELAVYPGFWRLAARYWRTGVREIRLATSRKAFTAAAQELVPELRADDLTRAPSGVRAQAVDPAGRLLDDFHLVEAPGMLHVVNAPSPAATASLEIGRRVAERVDAAA